MTDALVSTDWLAQRLDDPRLRIIDVPATPDAYAAGHIPGALLIDWRNELIPHYDESSGHVIDAERFAALARRLGLRPDDTLVFYGDEGGRHACRALWTFEYNRHPGALHLMNGGREKWQREGAVPSLSRDRPLTSDAPDVAPSDYPVPSETDESVRATVDEILSRLGAGGPSAGSGQGFSVLDCRTADEHAGTDVRAARAGHIPGCTNVFWEEALAPDGSFRPKDELAALYARLPRDATVVAHCQLGMRSAHSWFILRHILDYPRVKNYDGSWQEWGNRDDTPIER